MKILINKIQFVALFFLMIFISVLKGQTYDQNQIKKTIYRDANDSLSTVDYYDGLGVLYESIQIGQSPQGHDVGMLYEYDYQGRLEKEWLPIVLPNNNGQCLPVSELQNHKTNEPYSSMDNLYYFHTTTRYTCDDYGFPCVEVTGPGDKWYTQNKPRKEVTVRNETTDPNLACLSLLATNSTVNKGQYYQDNTLMVKKFIDEEGNVSYEFCDKQGKTLLHRSLCDGVRHDTYYIYDIYGNLCLVLPPKATDAFEALNSGNYVKSNLDFLDKYAYQYEYDALNRCILKKIPGAASIYMVYDKADQLRLTQDGNQRERNVWSYIKYDVFGRIVINGEYSTLQSRAELQGIMDSETVYFETFNYSQPSYYSNNTYPIYSTTILITNFYDDYDFYTKAPSRFSLLLKSRMTSLCNAHKDSLKTRGLLTGTRVSVLGQSNTTYRWNAYFYDGLHEQPYKTFTSNQFNRVDLEELEMNYIGQVLQKTVLHAASDAYVTEYFTYNYDNAGRLQDTYHRLKISNTYMDEVCLEHNNYNEIGQLASRVIGNGQETQQFTYNIRGWTTDISGDYFEEHLYYETKRDGSNGRFNGNISQHDIRYRAGGYGGLEQLQFDNTYDQLNRLTESRISGGEFYRFGENIDYDKHGNITSLHRGGISEHAWILGGSVPMPDHDYALVDALQYTYDGNQVTKVEDAHYSAYYLGAQDFKNNAWQANEYAYDANGNMVKDLNKEIVTLSYNSLNLPDTIQLKDGHMEALSYDAAGRKEGVTRVTVNTSGVTIPIGKTLENAGVGAVSKSYAYTKYASNVVYDNTHISEILLPGGILKRTNALTTNPPVFSYYYYVNDHLGNVRAVIDGSGTIKQVNNYYPFGMEYGESSENQSMMTFQNYQFGGKEFDRKYELNLYDFGARFYDATRGQWATPDPLAEKYYSISPYVYCANNPLKYIDPDGQVLVDANNKPITYNQKTGWSANVTQDVFRIGEAMMLTDVGKRQLNSLIASDIKVKMILDPGSNDTKLGNAKIDHSNNTATITIYEGAITESVETNNVNSEILKNGGTLVSATEKDKLLLSTTPTVTQRIGQVGVHEAEHILNPKAWPSKVGVNTAEKAASKKEIEAIKQTQELNGKLPIPKIKGI